MVKQRHISAAYRTTPSKKYEVRSFKTIVMCTIGIVVFFFVCFSSPSSSSSSPATESTMLRTDPEMAKSNDAPMNAGDPQEYGTEERQDEEDEESNQSSNYGNRYNNNEDEEKNDDGRESNERYDSTVRSSSSSEQMQDRDYDATTKLSSSNQYEFSGRDTPVSSSSSSRYGNNDSYGSRSSNLSSFGSNPDNTATSNSYLRNGNNLGMNGMNSEETNNSRDQNNADDSYRSSSSSSSSSISHLSSPSSNNGNNDYGDSSREENDERNGNEDRDDRDVDATDNQSTQEGENGGNNADVPHAAVADYRVKLAIRDAADSIQTAESDEVTKESESMVRYAMKGVSSLVTYGISKLLSSSSSSTNPSDEITMTQDEVNEIVEEVQAAVIDEVKEGITEELTDRANELMNEQIQTIGEIAVNDENYGMQSKEIETDVQEAQESAITTMRDEIDEAATEIITDGATGDIIRQRSIEIEKEIIEKRLSDKYGKRIKIIIDEDDGTINMDQNDSDEPASAQEPFNLVSQSYSGSGNSDLRPKPSLLSLTSHSSKYDATESSTNQYVNHYGTTRSSTTASEHSVSSLMNNYDDSSNRDSDGDNDSSNSDNADADSDPMDGSIVAREDVEEDAENKESYEIQSSLDQSYSGGREEPVQDPVKASLPSISSLLKTSKLTSSTATKKAAKVEDDVEDEENDADSSDSSD